MIGYKGFGKNLKCIDYQYEIGKTSQIDSNKTLTVCPRNANEGGLHFCLNPLNVLTYYENVDNNRFCIVESVGITISHHEDSKIATDKLKVIREITYDELVQLGIEYSIENGINFEIYDYLFQKLPESLKADYILMRIKDGLYISSNQFKWCSEELKGDYILMSIEKGWDITDKMKDWYSEHLFCESKK
jgi:hypothetical protein